MINWTKTNELGTKDLNSYRPKVVMTCDQCGKEAIITIRVKSRVINNQLSWDCPKCVTSRQEVRSVLSTISKQRWYDEQYRERE